MQKDIPPSPQFPGVTAPSTDFGAVLNGQRSMLRVAVIDLSTARTALTQFKITGNAFYVDQAADVGQATCVFEGVQDQTPPPIVAALAIGPGFVARVPFANIAITNTAQPGKVLRIAYGVDVDFTPAISNNLTINAIPAPASPGAFYKSATALALNTPEQVFSAAQNINGAQIWNAQFISFNSGSTFPLPAFVAKSTSPASNVDGNVIVNSCGCGAGGTVFSTWGQLTNPIFIAPGLGLFFISSNGAETGALRSCAYTLL